MENLQIHNKRIGHVEIVELIGELTHDALRYVSLDATEGRGIENSPYRAVLFNVKRLISLDEPTLMTLSDHARKYRKAALISRHNDSGPDVGKSLADRSSIRVLESEDDIAFYFRYELVEGTDMSKSVSKAAQGRRFERLDAALPLHISWENEEGRLLDVFAIVTNLSEGGVYAQFIDSMSERLMIGCINPYDFKMLTLKLCLNDREFLTLQGKCVHRGLGGNGIGIEFYGVDTAIRRQLREWLDRHAY